MATPRAATNYLPRWFNKFRAQRGDLWQRKKGGSQTNLNNRVVKERRKRGKPRALERYVPLSRAKTEAKPLRSLSEKGNRPVSPMKNPWQNFTRRSPPRNPKVKKRGFGMQTARFRVREKKRSIGFSNARVLLVCAAGEKERPVRRPGQRAVPDRQQKKPVAFNGVVDRWRKGSKETCSSSMSESHTSVPTVGPFGRETRRKPPETS